MDDPISTAVLSEWQELREVAQNLIANLTDDQMVSQPINGVTMNHPAWVLSHLSAYAPVLAAILRGETVEDPLSHRFGRGTLPGSDTTEYLSRSDLISSYVAVYDDAALAFAQASPDRLGEPNPIERWLTRFPTIGYLPGQFLVKHNAYHLGQLSAWRRASGLPQI